MGTLVTKIKAGLFRFVWIVAMGVLLGTPIKTSSQAPDKLFFPMVTRADGGTMSGGGLHRTPTVIPLFTPTPKPTQAPTITPTQIP